MKKRKVIIGETISYQYKKEKAELRKILKKHISEEILKWQETFQLSFYKEIFRLWDIPFTDENISRNSWLIGKLTNELVYKNMPEGYFLLKKYFVFEKWKAKKGNYEYSFNQLLDSEMGKEALKKVIYTVEALASVSETRTEFLQLIEKKYQSHKVDMTDKKTQEIEFDKILRNAINTPPLTLKDLKEQLKKSREKKKEF